MKGVKTALNRTVKHLIRWWLLYIWLALPALHMATLKVYFTGWLFNVRSADFGGAKWEYINLTAYFIYAWLLLSAVFIVLTLILHIFRK